MLPKKKRISRKEFLNILKISRRHHSTHLLMFVAKTNQTSSSKFSFSVPKTVFKKAVDRNRYRRRGYSIISKKFSMIRVGYSCLFSFKKGKYPLKFEELEAEIISLLSSSGVLI